MSDKAVITISGLGCFIVLALIAATIGGFVGIIVAVAKWIAA